MLGGGMRQSGVLAAAGLWALKNNVERLADDHESAQKIAGTLAGSSWAALDPADVETNIIFFRTPERNPESVVEQLRKKGILCGAAGPDSIRMVTSLAVPAEEADEVCRILRNFSPSGNR